MNDDTKPTDDPEWEGMTEPHGAYQTNALKKAPIISLRMAANYATVLDEHFGRRPFSRSDAYQALGLSPTTGLSAQKIASLVHFSILERDATGYSITSLARHIARPSSKENLDLALKKAFEQPLLFPMLVNKYCGKVMPQPSLLQKELEGYGIGHHTARKVATAFRDTVKLLGLISNGVITESYSALRDGIAEKRDVPPVPSSRPKEYSRMQKENTSNHVPPQPSSMLRVSLPSGLVLFYPTEIAHLVAFGRFGSEISALDKAITKAKEKNE